MENRPFALTVIPLYFQLNANIVNFVYYWKNSFWLSKYVE